jgi:hypothetical protein
MTGRQKAGELVRAHPLINRELGVTGLGLTGQRDRGAWPLATGSEASSAASRADAALFSPVTPCRSRSPAAPRR